MDDKWSSRDTSLEYPHKFVSANDEKTSKFVEFPAVMTQTRGTEENSVTKLLGDINLNAVKDISLCCRQIAYLPESFGLCLPNLECLDLSRNKLKNVPHSLICLIQLRQLFLDHNSIRYLPLTITEISHLTVLRLSHNDLETLPESIADLQYLETLILSCNRLVELPFSCKRMNGLRILDLSENRLKRVPRCIVSGMENLEELDLSRNLYINASCKPASSEKLRKLRIRDARCNVKFPLWILNGKAPRLEILDLDGTSFIAFDFPEKSSCLAIKILSLQHCSIYDSFLKKILSLTGELVSLRAGNGDSLQSGNAFWKMHIDELKNPEKVTKIDLRSTGLPVICPSIENFVNLVKLDIGHNSMSWLSNEICRLKKLEILAVDENLLSSLPDRIGEMSSLRELRANGNNLACLPDTTSLLKNLAYLDLYENDFADIPKILESMEKLVGLDIDQNLVDIEDCRIGEVEYKELRKSLRKRYRIDKCDKRMRETGPRYETEIEEQSDASSENSSLDCYESNAKTTEDVTNAIEENWDESEDSADDYDPTCDNHETMRKPLIQFNYRASVSRSFYFCPAIFHPPSMKQQIARLRERGLFEKYADTEVEGQFDDV